MAGGLVEIKLGTVVDGTRKVFKLGTGGLNKTVLDIQVLQPRPI